MRAGGHGTCRVPPFSFYPKVTKMKKFNWDVIAFDFSDAHRGRYRVQIEEAEDAVSGAIMMLKEAKSDLKDGPSLDILDDTLSDLSATVDKIRKLRSDLKNL
jgi:hypothetical protein